MADIALSATVEPSATVTPRAGILRWLRVSDALFLHATRGAAILVLAILSGIILSLIQGAMPALQTFGLGFLTSLRWNPVTDRYGALASIYGTVVTSFIALLIAVPFGLLIAVFLTELCPTWLRRPIGIAIELLAGVPSIIYGIWGFFVFGPFLQVRLEPLLIRLFENVPVLSAVLEGPPQLASLFNASLILAIMVLPFVTSISRDVFEAVPAVLKEAAYGVGCTTWEVVWHVVLPFARVGVIGGVMLALGRALGETMAVTFVIGNDNKVPTSILAAGTSISAKIANEFNSTETDLQASALIALGLILFVITFIVLAAARLLLLRLEKQVG
jgi:phosphate transport system permease protein